MAGMMLWKVGLARLEPVRVAVVEREEAAAVLHQHAGVAGDHGRAEVVVDRLDFRHHKAVAVGGAEIDGVAVSWPAVGSGTVAQARLDPADR